MKAVLSIEGTFYSLVGAALGTFFGSTLDFLANRYRIRKLTEKTCYVCGSEVREEDDGYTHCGIPSAQSEGGNTPLISSREDIFFSGLVPRRGFMGQIDWHLVGCKERIFLINLMNRNCQIFKYNDSRLALKKARWRNDVAKRLGAKTVLTTMKKRRSR